MLRCTLFAAAAFSACTPNTTFYEPEYVRCADNPVTPPTALRLASYNVKSGLESSLDRVAEQLRAIDPDVVALQEVDVGVDRTGRIDEAAELGARLGMTPVFAATIDRGGGAYGIAMLSRVPIQSSQRVELRAFGTYEPRVAIDAELCMGTHPIRFIAVHADFINPTANLEVLARHIAPYVGSGVVVAGDLNAGPKDAGPKHLVSRGLVDLFHLDERFTFWPAKTRVDYVFADMPIARHVAKLEVGDDKASDHFPIWADVELPQWPP